MGSKVLLADDSVTIQKVVGIIFANEGYDLSIVATGDAAVRKAVEITPDVMLVDALMPGKNGYEVCREIRQNPKLSHVAIILMTGAFEVVDEDKNRICGADEFITKPFESQALIDATNRMIALTAERASAPVPAQAAAPVATPSAAAPDVDDVWASGFDMEPAAEISQSPVLKPVEDVAPVKVTAADDLWGAFDMDSFETSPQPVQMPVQVAATADDDFFSLDTELPKSSELPGDDEFILDDVATAPPVQAQAAVAVGFEPVGEQEISFADFTPGAASAEEIQPVSLPAEDDFSTISFDEPAPAPVVPVPPPLPPVVEMAPPVQPLAPPAPEPPPVSEPVRTAPVAAPVALDEAQLRALLSTVSREMIEKIVWEVVPDLAETIIKEEIRKLKAGLA